MPEFKTISQRNLLKGLQATYSLFSQPGAILTRLSNLLYDKRGGLRTSDGSFTFTRSEGFPPYGPFTDISLYSPPARNAYYVGIQKGNVAQQGLIAALTGTPITVGGAIASITRNAGIITLVTAAAHNLAALSSLTGQPFNPGFLVVSGVGSGFDVDIPYNQLSIVNGTTISYPQPGLDGQTASGGTLGTQLPPGTYHYNITACDGSGGETPGMFGGAISVTVTAPENAVVFSWTPGDFDTTFSIYNISGPRQGRLNPGPGALQTIPGTAYADIGLLSLPGQLPPVTNTTQTCQIYLMPAGFYSEQLGTVPPFTMPMLGGIPGTNAGAGSSSGAGPNPQGGVIGATSPLPQMAQFTGRLVFALGNGYPVQQYSDPSIDGTGFAPVENNFSSQYPDWQASVAWNQGDQIKDPVTGGIFQAQQSGTSGAAAPTFVNQLNATTADNTIIWVCIATAITPTPLRGAAHAIVYAGSMWLANTWPTTTADLLDGPNVLKMSDVNTLTSWNPLNIAFIAKDDGDQITGLATFTIAESGISPTGSLVVFKNFTTYQVTGVFGASDFAIQQAQTDLGCIAPRSIQFVPGFGIMRFTHLGFAYFNGVADKLESEPIRPYLFGGEDDIQPVDWNFAYFAKGAQAANPPMYLCALPIAAPNVTVGFSILNGTAGTTQQLYARLSQLALVNGTWTETNISAEQIVNSGDQSVKVFTPAAQPNMKYRVYLGLAPGGEDHYAEAATFNGTVLAYATMTAGGPSIGVGSLQRLVCYDLVQKTWAVIDLPFPISVLKQVRAPGTVPLTIAGGFSDSQVRRMFAGDTTWDTGAAVAWSMRGAEVFQEGGSGKVFYRRLTVRGKQAVQASIQVTVTLGGVAGQAITAQQNNMGGNQWLFRVDILKDAFNANATVSGTGPITIDSLDWQVKPKPSGGPVSIQK